MLRRRVLLRRRENSRRPVAGVSFSGMAKKRPRKNASAAPGPEPDAGPFHAAFAGLASLRDELPEGEVASVASVEEASAGEPLSPAKVVVRRERKGRKGKTVTRVSGFGTDAAGWARRMKQELGCGGSVDFVSCSSQQQGAALTAVDNATTISRASAMKRDVDWR